MYATYKKYTYRVGVSCMTLIALCGLLNLLVDPLAFWNTKPIEGLTAHKPHITQHMYLVKSAEIRHQKPQAVILGSSRMLQGMDPAYFYHCTGQPIYNLGHPATTLYEIRHCFEHALHNNPDLKYVLIGLDFFAFKKNAKSNPEFDLNRLKRSRPHCH